MPPGSQIPAYGVVPGLFWPAPVPRRQHGKLIILARENNRFPEWYWHVDLEWLTPDTGKFRALGHWQSIANPWTPASDLYGQHSDCGPVSRLEPWVWGWWASCPLCIPPHQLCLGRAQLLQVLCHVPGSPLGVATSLSSDGLKTPALWLALPVGILSSLQLIWWWCALPGQS